MTVVIPCLDEELVIERKIDDVLKQEYPSTSLDVVVVADGSCDRTVPLAQRRGVRVLWQPERRGKAVAVNRGVAAAEGSVVCITDANCLLSRNSIRALAESFHDDNVAVAAGAKTVAGDGAKGRGESLYWRLESYLQRNESDLGCMMGAPGEVYAVRRSEFHPIPPHIINDDFHILCEATARGFNVRHVAAAQAQELVSPTFREEFERRSRIAAGTWQTTLMHLRLLTPRNGLVAVAFLSHRVLRSIIVPLLLPTIFILSGFLGSRSRAIKSFFHLQVGFYTAALVGIYTDRRILAAPSQFVLTNAAALRGGWRYVTGRQPVAWTKARRSEC